MQNDNLKPHKKVTPGLGKGLNALIPNVALQKDNNGFNMPKIQENQSTSIIDNIDIDKISTNPYQPRIEFDAEALEELKNSILEHGVIQPITVRRALNGFELISGERRLRASKLAGLNKIPAYIMDVQTNVQMLEIAIIENVQREDLNPIEIALGYQKLIEECNLTQEDVSIKVGKNRSTVTNFLRLLKLPEKVMESLKTKEISMGHARAILALDANEDQIKALKEIIDNQLSVRQTEVLIKAIQSQDEIFTPEAKELTKSKSFTLSDESKYALESFENELRHKYGTEVKIKTKSPETGSIEFQFYSKDDLERLLEIFDNNFQQNL